MYEETNEMCGPLNNHDNLSQNWLINPPRSSGLKYVVRILGQNGAINV